MQVMDHKLWIQLCSQRSDACVLFAAIWWIWHGRNNHVFSGANMEDRWILSNIALDVDVFKSNMDTDSVGSSILRWIKWTWPRDGVVKLNMDGCSKGNPGRVGIGGLLHGDNVQWLVGFISYRDVLFGRTN